MKYTKRILFLAILLVFLIPVIPSVTPAATPTRENTVWAAGYQTKAENLNPLTTGPAYGVAYMYEPLFGYNFLASEVIPVIGKSYEWNADGSKILVELNTAAKWSDGDKITAEDVIFTYNVAARNTTQFGPDLDKRLDSITKVDSNSLEFNMKADFYFSSRMEDMLRTNLYIVPEEEWTAIMAANDDLDLFMNDWFASGFNDAWKICSGPYEPYSRSATMDEELYQKRSGWWGSGKIHTDLPDTGGKPKVEFIGLRQYPTNPAQDTAFLTGETDLHAGYYDQIWIAMGQNTDINTWYGKKHPFYLGLGSLITIAFNHRTYPFNQVWLREAIAYCLDYDTIAYVAASGYWARARQGYLDDRSPTHLSVYSSEVQEEYGIDYDVEECVAILEEHCTGSVEAGWVTKVNPTPLGPWTIITQLGWTDVVKATKLWAEYMTAVGIPTVMSEEIADNNVAAIEDGTFQMSMNCVTPALVNAPTRFLGGWRGSTSYWGGSNHSAWTGAKAEEFEATYESYETLQAGSAGQIAAAKTLQTILASEIPEIPTTCNGFWYAYSVKYWEGWVSEENNYNHVVTAYTVDQGAIKQRLILNLKPAGEEAEVIPWTGVIAFTILGMLGVVVLTRYRLISKKKKF